MGGGGVGGGEDVQPEENYMLLTICKLFFSFNTHDNPNNSCNVLLLMDFIWGTCGYL